MGLVSKILSGLWNGVSQQHPSSRKDNQLQLQENAIGSLVDGLYKRPGTEHMVQLDTPWYVSRSFMHALDRGDGDQYIVLITGDSQKPIEVYDTDGTEYSVRYGTIDNSFNFTLDNTKKTYVTSNDPEKEFKVMTMTTFAVIVNTTTTVAMDSDTTSGTLTGTVQSYVDLPESPTTGDIYKITGDPDNNFDNYYMYWDGTTWLETVNVGIPYKLDQDTMPHFLYKSSETQFTFCPFDWGERTVGDSYSNLNPSFVGSSISNTFFYKNRLGFLSQANVILSRSGGYYDFFRQSALDIFDDDPIDISVSTNDMTVLYSTATFDKSLVLFTSENQIDLSSDGGPLSPRTVTVTPNTTYKTEQYHTPANAGANAYFINPKDSYLSVREYYIQPDTLVTDAADVTAHVPKYIPSGDCYLESCNPLDMLFVNSSGDPQSLYVYKYFWNGQEKPQSAWSKWTFDAEISGIKVVGTTLYIVLVRGTLCLEKIQLENITSSTGYGSELDWRVSLDRMEILQGVYDSGSDTTTFTISHTTGYTGAFETYYIVDPDTGMPVYEHDMFAETTLTVEGDCGSTRYYVGTPFTMKVGLSQWYLKDRKDRPITDGRLQIRSLKLTYEDTGPFKVSVTNGARDTVEIEHIYSGVLIGTTETGEAALQSGSRRFPVMGNARDAYIEIESDTYLPLNLHAAMYEGWFNLRSKLL